MWIEVVLLALIIFTIYNINKKPSNYPPGPWGLPLIGYFPLGIKSFEKKLEKLRLKHGDIVSWRIGSRLIVFISDYNIVKEAFQSQNFADRPDARFFTLFEEKIGIIVTNGAHWHNIRRFTLRHLRDLGMGKSKLVSAVQYEAMELVKVMKKQTGKSAPIPTAMTPAVVNVLWQMIASLRYDLDDENVIRFHKMMNDAQDSCSFILIRDIFPWMESIFPEFVLNYITKKHKIVKLRNFLIEEFQVYVDEHKDTLDENNPRDFIDEYLIEMGKQKSDPDSAMSDEDLIGCITDLFLAGIETTTSTITWSIFHLAGFPEVQMKLQNEIDNALPNKTLVTLDDKSRLPYTEAFITEILRYTSLAPTGLPRTASSDVKLGNYVIPKDAIVIPTSEVIHHSAKYFTSPTEFNPERFINSEGKFEAPKEGFLPFGVGKRQCLGESMARMQLFIFLVTMLQHFSFSAPPNMSIDLTKEDIPILNHPKRKQDVLITAR